MYCYELGMDCSFVNRNGQCSVTACINPRVSIPAIYDHPPKDASDDEYILHFPLMIGDIVFNKKDELINWIDSLMRMINEVKI